MREKKYTFLLLISLLCFILIAFPATVRGIIGFGCCGAIGICIVLRCRNLIFKLTHDSVDRNNKTVIILSCILAVGFMGEFIYVWLPSSRLKSFLSKFNIPYDYFVYLIGLGAAVGTVVFLREVFLLILYYGTNFKIGSFFHVSDATTRGAEALETKTESLSEKVLILACAVIAITVCSCSSPLYPMNSWVDVNAYFTVGKGMFRGMVPYRDLFDHKGPFLFLLYGLASLISPDSLRGGYLLEIIAAYIYLLFSYRIICFHLRNRYIIFVPIIAFITFSSRAFEQGGCPEELCLALIVFQIWMFLREYYKNDLQLWHYLLIGIIAGCIFWTKFSLVGIYIGWYIWHIINTFRGKNGKLLAKRSIMIFFGVVLATVPWVIYFGMNGAIKDWLEVYIYDNIFVYTSLPAREVILTKIPVVGGLATGFASAFRNNPVTIALLVFFAMIMVYYRKNRLAELYILLVLGTFSFIFMGGRKFIYYSLPLAAFLAPSLSLLFTGTAGKRLELLRKKSLTIGALFLFGIFLFTPNRDYMKYKKEELAQYQFKQIIAESNTKVTLLNYGDLDNGFYTVCDILPNCRAFYVANMLGDELLDVQDTYVNSGLCDYVVTNGGAENIESGDPERIGQSFHLYDLVAESTCPSNGSEYTFRLYKLKTLED